jgi:hypothetical protein
MNNGALSFVIPTCRLREVAETVRLYDEHFFRNGHAVDLYVFDDSTPAMQEKYFGLLEATSTHNPVYYVGPREKAAFVAYMNGRLRDRRLEPLVRSLFRPSYGGNRNVALMYTLGGLFVSVDDDMRPYTLVEDSPESLQDGEIARGKLFKTGSHGFTAKSFDILAAYLEVLGKRVGDLPANYLRGRLVRDSAMDLHTNSSRGLARENSLVLESGQLDPASLVKVAQTFRSGTSDADALDYVEMALDDESQTRLEDLNDQYVLVNFRPAVTKENWRIDCGVAGYDNGIGLPPFFPTRLRFEDYIYRLWIQKDGIVSAHVDAAQTHIKSNYMRSPLAADVFNEEVCNLLKTRIKDSLTRIDDLGIDFDYDGAVSIEDCEHMLERALVLHSRVTGAAGAATRPERAAALHAFAASLERAFYGFELDFFPQNVSRIVDDVVSMFRGSLELWPTLIEIAYLQKRRAGFPAVLVSKGGHVSPTVH